ncbi:hypothetical protein OSW16_07655 [Pseudomonas putida]|uniref:hypothetical protein n=1 Tax=Pseudomonas putida TaxID=303 RepID=UPI002271434E|nr:hypothetical protein [Pseudomonas putida]WAB99509.1 hypothetical protein OSW16_07655 [Pseudomonas putida]
MAKYKLLCSLLTLLLLSVNHAAVAQGGGTITLLNPQKDKCIFDIPGPGTGVTQQFNLTAYGSSLQCKDWKVRSLVLTDLPSSATIYMTDDPWCTRGKGKHEITLRISEASTSTDPRTPWEIANLYTFQPGYIITRGVKLQSMTLKPEADPQDSVECIEVRTSADIDTPKLKPTSVDASGDYPTGEKDSKFNCPPQWVITGRRHYNDENGQTIYTCARLKQGDSYVVLSEQSQSRSFIEKGGHYFTCPPNQVMTGRDHYSDENGDTVYRCMTPKTESGHRLTVTPEPWSNAQREKGSNFQCGPTKVMIGRWHYKDENGDTRVRCALVQ